MAMSVELEFQPDSRVASDASAGDPAALFEQTLLVVPVRLRVGGQDMLAIGRSSTTAWSVNPSGTAAPTEPVEFETWTEEPLLGFLCRLRDAVAAAQRSGRAHCYLIQDRDLTLTLRQRSHLAVTSPTGTVTAVAPLHEFIDEIGRFEGSVREWLEAEAPQLVRHPSWPEWFPEGRS